MQTLALVKRVCYGKLLPVIVQTTFDYSIVSSIIAVSSLFHSQFRFKWPGHCHSYCFAMSTVYLLYSLYTVSDRLATSQPLLCHHCFATRDWVARRRFERGIRKQSTFFTCRNLNLISIRHISTLRLFENNKIPKGLKSS